MSTTAGLRVYPVVKRLGDIAAASIGLIAVSPFLVFTMLGLALTQRGKIWFVQPRPGKNEEIFNIIKFRTMTDERDASGVLLPDENRLTQIGKIIRKLSIDELPQLINVLKGDMSIVGPRPLLVEYLERYNAEQRRRHMVKPGITGWAQVNGRNTLRWKTRFEYDVWYVDHMSFWLDLKILFLTAVRVLRMDGISSGTSETMEPFRGNE